jgi:hypothetical protein
LLHLPTCDCLQHLEFKAAGALAANTVIEVAMIVSEKLGKVLGFLS